MNEDNKNGDNSFRNILKNTSIFGGVQVFNILISAIRLKFVAVILGPSGMGIAGLFNTSSLTIQQFASLGLNMSIVKEIGHSKDKESRLANLLAAIRPLILISGLLGAFVCILFPGLLSSLTFGDNSYRGGFLMLSAAVFFSLVGSALMSVLQGLHSIKPLSKATLIVSIVGLTFGVPLYWIFGTDGIVPALVLLSFSTCTWYYISLRKTLNIKVSAWNKEIHFPLLKKVLSMGIILMSNDLFLNLVNYLINVYIRRNGGMDEVGFFQSCNTMTSQYSAIVFTAMAMDYLPRLSSAADNNEKMCDIVNRQIEIVGLLIAPIACAVILLSPFVIRILQTDQFLSATPLLRLLALAVVVRALMYPLGYIVFAKDNRRLFFWMESIGANILTLMLSCSGYYLFGLKGLGIASITDCLICLCVYIFVNKRLYNYKPSKRTISIMLFSLASGTMMAAICFLDLDVSSTICGSVLLVAICIISAKMLLTRLKYK